MAGKAAIPSIASLELLRLIATPEEFAEAVKLARERLKITPAKLALMLVRLINPDEIIGETDEAKLRGLSPQTLRDMKSKERSELPAVIQGSVKN